jgi:NAD(P)-dependent dehydrogenase (short-subunit alcohol dehydrogenase family)
MSTRAAIVTGAGGAVGGALARQLAEAGWAVALTSRSEQKAAATAQAIEKHAPDAPCAVLPADLTDEHAARGVVEQASERFGRLDALAHVAGRAGLVPVEQISAEAWRATIDVNVSALMHLAAAAWEPLAAQGGGRIAGVSSMAAIDPMPGFSLYAPAKAAENMFLRVAARQGADRGIETVTLAPGAIETAMLRGLFSEGQLPRDRTLDPEDVAAALRDCLTGERAFTSGEVIEMPSP